jgi:hypothetical protein
VSSCRFGSLLKQVSLGLSTLVQAPEVEQRRHTNTPHYFPEGETRSGGLAGCYRIRAYRHLCPPWSMLESDIHFVALRPDGRLSELVCTLGLELRVYIAADCTRSGNLPAESYASAEARSHTMGFGIGLDSQEEVGTTRCLGEPCKSGGRDSKGLTC